MLFLKTFLSKNQVYIFSGTMYTRTLDCIIDIYSVSCYLVIIALLCCVVLSMMCTWLYIKLLSENCYGIMCQCVWCLDYCSHYNRKLMCFMKYITHSINISFQIIIYSVLTSSEYNYNVILIFIMSLISLKLFIVDKSEKNRYFNQYIIIF